MAFIKKSFTLIELAVVFTVILILSTMVFVGIGQTGKDEGLKADYLEFLSNLKSLQTRANLGQLAPTLVPSTAPTSMHTLVFTLPATSYSIDGATVNFKNRSSITSVNAYNSGVVTLSFVPNSNNYQGPTPQLGSFAAVGTNKLTDSVMITLTGKSLATKTITITGDTFYISNIN